MKNILFWDIDGTLIRTSRAGLFAFEEAIVSLWGRSISFADIESAGMTDHYIAGQVIRKLTERDATEAEIIALTARYESLLQEHLHKREGWVLPSVRDILQQLGAQPEYQMLLLTGNSRNGSEIKLRHLGLDHHFDFENSAFCDKSAARIEIALRAQRIIRELHGEEGYRLFVIGDTPNDVFVGKKIGAYTVAVATGTFTTKELLVHEPWWTVSELPGVEEFEAKIRSA